jgi:hypothetical protein
MYVSTDFIDFPWKQSLETIFSAKKMIFNTLKYSQNIEISYLPPPEKFSRWIYTNFENDQDDSD